MLVAGQPFGEEFVEIRQSQILPGDGGDRDRHLAPLVVGPADHGHLDDGRVSGQ